MNTASDIGFVEDFFAQAIAKNRLARSYLLLSGDLAEKKALIKKVNKALNCQSSMDDPAQGLYFCGECQNCKWIEAASHPKTPITISLEKSAKNIKVEQVRVLQEELNHASNFFRVVIIEEARSSVLNKFAATALLKTIEEARPNTMFFFLADFRDAVLNTIASRCQALYFAHSSRNEYPEAILQLVKKFDECRAAKSSIDLLASAEAFAESSREDLLAMFDCLQFNYSEDINLDNWQKSSELVFALEEAKNDLKYFVRPVASIYALLSKFRGVQAN